MIWKKFIYPTFISLALAHNTNNNEKPDMGLSLPDQLQSQQQLADWELSGKATVEKDKIKLTPIDLGNQYGTIWSKGRLNHPEWTVELGLTVGGPDKAGGGLAFWYTNEKSTQQGPVNGGKDQWDGLAVLLDSFGNNGKGTLRGHLNDGSIKYYGSQKKDVVEQAFSLCAINYRNTGNIFNVRVGYGQGRLIVDVNGQKCFEVDKVNLPQGQFIGVSAASVDNPDSFNLHKLRTYPVLVNDMKRHISGQQEQPPQQQQQQQKQNQQPLQQQVDRREYDDLKNQLSQHNEKLQKVDSHHTSLEELQKTLQQVQLKLSSLESKVNDYQSSHGAIKGDVQKSITSEVDKLKQQLDAQISRTVNDHATSVFGTIPDTINEAMAKGGPSFWVMVVIVIFVQGVLFVGYNVYKTRRSYHAKIL